MRPDVTALLLSCVLAAHGAACDLHVELTNAPPVVTWAHATPAADGIVDVTLWVYDLEAQPVDLTLTWSLDGADQGAVSIASGGHGTLGLTTDQGGLGADGRPNPDGQSHLIRWAIPADLAGGGRLRLHVLADDRVSEPGPVVATPSQGFLASEGIAAPVRLELP